MQRKKLREVKITDHKRRSTSKLQDPKIKHPVTFSRFSKSEHHITENQNAKTNRSAPAKSEIISRQAKNKSKRAKKTHSCKELKSGDLKDKK